MKICVAGQVHRQKHLDALKRIPDVEITSLVGGESRLHRPGCKKLYGIPHYTGELSEGIKPPSRDLTSRQRCFIPPGRAGDAAPASTC